MAKTTLRIVCLLMLGLIGLQGGHQVAAAQATSCLDVQHPLVRPPDGFNPAAASSAQLACYGLPPRPTTQQDLQAWSNLFAGILHWDASTSAPGHWNNYTFTERAPGLTSHQQAAASGLPAHINIWGGYVADASSGANMPFDFATGEWHQQDAKNNDGHGVADWVGLGGLSGSDQLYQDGTEIFDPAPCTILCPKAGMSFFYDIPPAGNTYVVSPTLHVGDDVSTAVAIGYKIVYFYLVNHTTKEANVVVVPQATPNEFTARSAEWVVEDAWQSQFPAPPVLQYTSYNPVLFGPGLYSQSYTTSGPVYSSTTQLALTPYFMGPANVGPIYLGPSSLNRNYFVVCSICQPTTPTPTPATSPTATQTAVATNTPTSTATATPSNTPTSTTTNTPASTATATTSPSLTPSATSTPSSTIVPTYTPTATFTSTPTALPATPTATPSGSNCTPSVTSLGAGPPGSLVTIPQVPSTGYWEAAYWQGPSACNGGALMAGSGSYDSNCDNPITGFPITCNIPSNAQPGINYISVQTDTHDNDMTYSYMVTSTASNIRSAQRK